MGNLGWTEILVILVIALIIFGPRKLPELGKSLGQSLAQFRRASDDFKRTWEQEVEIEKRRFETSPVIPDQLTGETVATTEPSWPVEATETGDAASPAAEEPAAEAASITTQEVGAKETKRDWM